MERTYNLTKPNGRIEAIVFDDGSVLIVRHCEEDKVRIALTASEAKELLVALSRSPTT